MQRNSFSLNLPSFFVGISLVFAALSVVPNRVSAQTSPDGYNAICLTTACTDTGIGTTIAASSAFIDASAFCSTGGACSTSSGDDFCVVVNKALAKLPSTGGVVDARAVMTQTGSSKGTIACTTSTTPFTGITAPSTVLLPSGLIDISTTWVLPDRTRIVGEGNNPQGGTQIYAASDFSGGTMIQMGSSTVCPSSQCYGIGVEYVFLGGSSQSINGIVNQYGGTGSYVDHVNFHAIEATGLVIGDNATDSGPYSNLQNSATSSCVKPGGSEPSTSCVHLGDSTYGSPQSTRGIHGLTCTCPTGGSSGSGYAQVAVAVNSSNNTLEDIHFEGYIDGIELGAQGNAQNNVILNVNGGETATDNMTSVIHICSSTSTGCANSNTVSDVTILGALTTISSSGNMIKYVIEDDVSGGYILSASSPNVTSVGKYVLGDKIGSTAGAYSRFTNSSSLPTWSSSSTAATSTTACENGSLLSNINGVSGGGTSSNYTLWVCKGGLWTNLAH